MVTFVYQIIQIISLSCHLLRSVLNVHSNEHALRQLFNDGTFRADGKKKKVRTNRVALHSVGSGAELSLRLCFAALSHRTQHKRGGTNPSLENTRPPLHLKRAGIRCLSRHCKICISEWHLQLYPPHGPRDVSFNLSYFDFYDRFMPKLTQNAVCIRTAFISGTVHQNNVVAFQWLWEACAFVLVHMLVCVCARTLASGLSLRIICTRIFVEPLYVINLQCAKCPF